MIEISAVWLRLALIPLTVCVYATIALIEEIC